MRGYKVFHSDWRCRGKLYTVGKEPVSITISDSVISIGNYAFSENGLKKSQKIIMEKLL